MSLSVMILAGGLATRMRPFTEKVPKSLLPVAGKAFIDWQLAQLKQNGIGQVVLCVGYLGRQIEEHLAGKDYGLDILFSYDGDVQLGTGGALKKAADLAGEAFFVLYGDSYLDINYRLVEAYWRRSGKEALMTVFCNENRWDTSNVQYKDGNILAYSKQKQDAGMQYIDYGLGILSASALEGYGTVFDLADVYGSLAKKGRLAGYEAQKRFFEIGSTQGLKDLGERLKNR